MKPVMFSNGEGGLYDVISLLSLLRDVSKEHPALMSIYRAIDAAHKDSRPYSYNDILEYDPDGDITYRRIYAIVSRGMYYSRLYFSLHRSIQVLKAAVLGDEENIQ